MTSTIVESSIVNSRGSRKHLLIIAILFFVVHGAIFIHGVLNADSFLAGDRAVGRLETINYVFSYPPTDLTYPISILEPGAESDSTILSRIFESGHPGDYILQGLLLGIGDRHLVVTLQLLLAFISIICVYFFVIILRRSPAYAMTGAVIYMLLPGNLIIPHELASESLFTPSVVVGFFMLIYYVEKQPHIWVLVSGLLLLTAANFIRPQLGLYPFVLIVIFAACYRQQWKRHVALVLLISFSIPACWGLYSYSHTDNISPGGKNHGPGIAFYKTVKRMSVNGEFPFEPSAYPDGKMSVRELAAEVIQHPLSFLKLKATEALVLIINPGTYSLAAHHFGLLAGARDTAFWKELRDREGITGMVLEIFKRGPVLIAVIFAGTLAWCLILLGALIGGLAFSRGRVSSTASKAILVSYLFYGLMIVMVSSEVRWTHRNPVEFVIVIFFIVGIQKLHQRSLLQRTPTHKEPYFNEPREGSTNLSLRSRSSPTKVTATQTGT